MTLFESNQHMGNLIKELHISGTVHLDTTTIVSLPELFPNLEILDLSYISNKKVITDKRVEQAFEKWKHLKYVVDHISNNKYGISNTLLGSSVYKNLQQLNVSFHHNNNFLKTFISNLINAPILQELNLYGAEEICLLDMEDLHRNTPRLQKFKLDCYLLPKQTLDNILLATSLILISFDLAHMGDETSSHITQWCDYIGKKYTNLTSLRIEGIFYPIVIIDEDYFINMLDHMPDLVNYEVQLRPITDRIMDIIGTRHIKLKNMELWVDNDDGLVYAFQLLKSHAATLHLPSLSIITEDASVALDGVFYFQELFQLFQTLTNLVDLKIIFYYSESNFLCCIVQNLLSLESLSFGDI